MNTPTNDRELLARRRIAHHAALGSLIGSDATAGLKLWSKLRPIERTLYAVCLAYTNAEPCQLHGFNRRVQLADWERYKEQARVQLIALFGEPLPAGVFINGDPRGHMLKLDCDVRPIPDGMERDWGGNGILAAEIE